MICAGHVARMGNRGSAERILVGNLRERDYLQDLDRRRYRRKQTLNESLRRGMGAWTGLIWLRIGRVDRSM
jgi:hypothetical protein